MLIWPRTTHSQSQIWDAPTHKKLSFHNDGLGRRVLKIVYDELGNAKDIIRYSYDG